MAPSRRRGTSKAAAAAAARCRQYKVGDLVLAKVKGFPAWPATVSEPEKWGYPADCKKVLVYFFGTQQIAFCNPADVEAFTEEKKESLLVKRHGKGSDFGRAAREIIESYEKLKKEDQVTNGNTTDDQSLISESNNAESLTNFFPKDDTPTTASQSCRRNTHCSAAQNVNIKPSDAEAVTEDDLQDVDILPKETSFVSMAAQTGMGNTYLTRGRIESSQAQKSIMQRRPPSTRRTRSSSRVDTNKLQSLMTTYSNYAVCVGGNVLRERSARRNKRIQKSPDAERLDVDSPDLASNCSIEGNDSEILTADSDNLSLNEGSTVESDCKTVRPESVNELCQGDAELSQRLDFQANAVIRKKKRKPCRKRPTNDAAEFTVKLDEKTSSDADVKTEHNIPSYHEISTERYSKDDGDEHLPLVKRARVRMSRASLTGEEEPETSQDTEEKQQEGSNRIKELVCGSSNKEGDGPMDQCSSFAKEERYNSTPQNRYPATKPQPWEVRKNGCPLDGEAALPPSKRLHRALEKKLSESPNSISEMVGGSSNEEGDGSTGQSSSLSKEERDNSSPQNRYPATKPQPGEVRKNGGSLDGEAALPPAKCLHRALEEKLPGDSNRFSEMVGGSSSKEGDCSTDQSSSLAKEERDDSSPQNRYPATKPQLWEVRKNGGSLDGEAALPPSKRLHRALEAMSANAIEDYQASSNEPSKADTTGFSPPAGLSKLSVKTKSSSELVAGKVQERKNASEDCISSDYSAKPELLPAEGRISSTEAAVSTVGKSPKQESCKHTLEQLDCSVGKLHLGSSCNVVSDTAMEVESPNLLSRNHVEQDASFNCDNRSQGSVMPPDDCSTGRLELVKPSAKLDHEISSLSSNHVSGNNSNVHSPNDATSIPMDCADASVNCDNRSQGSVMPPDDCSTGRLELVKPSAKLDHEISSLSSNHVSGNNSNVHSPNDATSMPMDCADDSANETAKSCQLFQVENQDSMMGAVVPGKTERVLIATSSSAPVEVLDAAHHNQNLHSGSTSYGRSGGKAISVSLSSSSLTDGLDPVVHATPHTSACNASVSDNVSIQINGSCSPAVQSYSSVPRIATNWNSREADNALASFEAILGTLTRTKESIGRATRVAIDCAKCGVAAKVVEILARSLERESSLRRRVDLFFLVDSIAQYSKGLKGEVGGIYPSAILAVLPRLLSAAAPPGSGSQDNRRQCLKVLRVWLERRIIPESIIRHHIRELDALCNSSCSRVSRRSRNERAFDDPIREMDGMLVDEYGSNSSFQLPEFRMPPMLTDEDNGIDSDGESFEAVTPEHNAERPDGERTPIPVVEKQRHILEEVDGELEMEDAAPPSETVASTSNMASINNPQFFHHPPGNSVGVPFAPPLPQDVPPRSPPLPKSPPPPASAPLRSDRPDSISNSLKTKVYSCSQNMEESSWKSTKKQPTAPGLDRTVSDSIHYSARGSDDFHPQGPKQATNSTYSCSFNSPPGSHSVVREVNSVPPADGAFTKGFCLRPPHPAQSNQFSYVQSDQRVQSRRDLRPPSNSNRFHIQNAENGNFYRDRDRTKVAPVDVAECWGPPPFPGPRYPDGSGMPYARAPYSGQVCEPPFASNRRDYPPRAMNYWEPMPYRPHTGGQIPVAARGHNYWRPR